jgi:hypothetical protein
MAHKEFARHGDLRLVSDERDIATPYSKRQEVYKWSGTNGITIEYQGTLGGTDVWRVHDEQHRAWFRLKWQT